MVMLLAWLWAPFQTIWLPEERRPTDTGTPRSIIYKMLLFYDSWNDPLNALNTS